MRRCTAMSDQTQGTFTSDLSALVAHVKRGNALHVRHDGCVSLKLASRPSPGLML